MGRRGEELFRRAAFVLISILLPASSFAVGPTISSLSPTSGAIGASVTIAGSGFGSTRGTSTVSFNGASASTILGWTSSQIIALVPNGASTGNVVVTVSGKASNGVLFTVLPAPIITSISPTSGPAGTSVTISGNNFGASQSAQGVQFNGYGCGVSSWSQTTIVATACGSRGNVVVYASGVASNGVYFAMWPNLFDVEPTAATVGNSVTLSGNSFGATQGNSTVTFNGTPAITITSWSDTSLVASVPPGATTGNVVVTVNGHSSSQVLTLRIFSGTPTSTTYHLHQEPGPVSGTYLLSTAGPDAASTSFVSPNLKGLSGGTAATFTAQIPAIIPYPATVNFSVWMSATASVSGLVPQLSVDDGLVIYNCINQGSTALTTSPAKYQFSCNAQIDAIFDQGHALRFSAGAWYQPGGTIRTNVQAQVYVEGSLNGSYDSQVTIPEVLAPAITGISPSSGAMGASITINGSNFNSTQGSAVVSFNGVTATPTSWNNNAIVVPVPSGATTGNVVVANGVSSNGVPFTVLPSPTISGLSPNSGPVGTAVTISGSNFGSSPGTVTFNGNIAPITSWGDGSIVAQVPNGATSGYVVVTANGVSSNGAFFSVAQIPGITAISPTTGPVGDSVTISGTNFGATQGTSAVTFNGTLGSPTNWSATSIVLPVPSGATTGNVIVSVAGWPSNGIPFTVVPTPNISSLSPASGPVGTSVTITGTNFGASQGTSTVTFNGTSATPTTWSNSSVIVPVPNGASTGNVVVLVNGVSSNGVSFTVLPTPNISNLSPTSGPVGTPITITGLNFGTTQNASTVTFNGTVASPTNWSVNSISAPVPNGATSGNVVITVNGVPSNGVYFTVTSTTPNLVSIAVIPANATMDVANTQAYAAIATYSDGSTQDVTTTSAWSSSSTAVATVDAAGNVITVVQGQSTIQASTGGISGSTTLTVTSDLTITSAYQSLWASQSYDPNQIAVGLDGFPRFVVRDTNDQQTAFIGYVHCLDLDCANSNTQQISTNLPWNSEGTTSMSTGPDGFARIAYTIWDGSGCQGPVYFVQCGDNDCGSSTSTLVGTGGPNVIASIATSNDGTSYIVYDNMDENSCGVGPTNVKLAACSGGSCSSTLIDSLYTGYGDLVAASVGIGSSGNPLVAYTDVVANLGGPPNTLYLYNGGRTLVSNDIGDSIVNLAVAPDGSAKILFPNSTATSINIANCSDASCGSPQITTLSPSGYWDGFASGAVDADGNAHIVVGVENQSQVGVDYIQCSSNDCSTYRTEGLEGEDWDGSSSITLDSDGLPHILAQTSTPIGSTQVIKHARRPVSATVTIRASTGQTISPDDSALAGYRTAEGKIDLGPIIGNGLYSGCFVGDEAVAKVMPRTYQGNVILHRWILWDADYTFSTPTPGGVRNQDDTSHDPAMSDTNPQSGGSAGKVYNVDAPGLEPQDALVTNRYRGNYYAYAALPDGTRISPYLNYYVRVSCSWTGMAYQFMNDVSGDNQIAPGTTLTTWDLK